VASLAHTKMMRLRLSKQLCLALPKRVPLLKDNQAHFENVLKIYLDAEEQPRDWQCCGSESEIIRIRKKVRIRIRIQTLLKDENFCEKSKKKHWKEKNLMFLY
jgi:hypothetical protein